MIIAPVPTLVGAMMVDLMTEMVRERFASVSRGVEAGRIRRERDRLIERLAAHGKIPATAVVETESATLRLDTVAGTITGRVRTGMFSNRDVEGMTVDELERFAASTDEGTAKLVRAYVEFRKASAPA